MQYIPYSPAGHHHLACHTKKREGGAPAPASAAQTDPNPVIISRRPPGFRPVGGPPALVKGLNERTNGIGRRNIGGGRGGAEELRRAVGFDFGRTTATRTDRLVVERIVYLPL